MGIPIGRFPGGPRSFYVIEVLPGGKHVVPWVLGPGALGREDAGLLNIVRKPCDFTRFSCLFSHFCTWLNLDKLGTSSLESLYMSKIRPGGLAP